MPINIVKFELTNHKFVIKVDNSTNLDLLITQKLNNNVDLANKYKQINFLYDYLRAKIQALKLIDYYEANELEEDYKYKTELICSGYLIGSILVDDSSFLEQLKYWLNLDNFICLPKVNNYTRRNHTVNLSFQNFNLPINSKINITPHLIEQAITFAYKEYLYTPAMGQVYSLIQVVINAKAYKIYCHPTHLTQLLVMFGLENNDDNTLIRDVLQHILRNILGNNLELSINNLVNNSKIKLQDYLEINCIINDININLLLNEWDFLNVSYNFTKELNNIVSLPDLDLDYPLVHGFATLNYSEICDLNLGDVILLDEVYSPDKVYCDLGNYKLVFNLNGDSKLQFQSFDAISQQ